MSVCLSVAYIGPKSRTERPRKTKIGTEIAHVTCDSDTTSRSKGQRSRSPGRFTHRRAVLARQAAAAVGVRTCWPWKTAATLPSAWRRKALRRPRGRRGAGAYRGGRPPTACYKQDCGWAVGKAHSSESDTSAAVSARCCAGRMIVYPHREWAFMILFTPTAELARPLQWRGPRSRSLNAVL